MYKNVQELNYSFDGEYLYDSYRNRIASIEDKPLEGLPLLVIKGEVDIPEFDLELEKLRFQQGYNKAKETYVKEIETYRRIIKDLLDIIDGYE